MKTHNKIRCSLQEHKTDIGCNSSWTVPNALTLARFAMVPVFLGAFIHEAYLLSLAVFILAGITDALDGFLARTLEQRSRLGAVIDPVADKLLVLTAFLCLGHVGWIPWWLIVVVVLREVLIVSGFAFFRFTGMDVRGKIAATLDSKLNTLGQIMLVLSVMSSIVFEAAALDPVSGILIYAVGGLTLISGLHYLLLGLGLVFFSGNDEKNTDM